METTTYNYIINTIKSGKKIAVQHNEGEWAVFLYIRPDGLIQGTHWQDKINESLESGLSGKEWSKKELLERCSDNTVVNDILLNPAPLLPKVGDKVEILENIRETAIKEKYGQPFLDLIGVKDLKVGRVCFAEIHVYNIDKSSLWQLPHWAVATLPVHWEEEKETVMTIAELEQLTGIKNLKISK
jgi:hypothetical protein